MNRLTINLTSKKMMTKVPVVILLPEARMGAAPADFYQSGQKYKVLFLLHGASVDNYGFLTNDNLNGMLRGSSTMVVMPYGINSDFANHMEFGTGYAFMDFFFEELMPFVQTVLSGSDKAEDNYIAGYSMGGAGALLLGLHHPEKFGGIGALGSSMRESEFLKPYLDMKGWEFRAFADANRTALPTEFGDPAYGITLKEINMIARYDTVRDYVNSEECTWERFPEALASENLKELYFCCGDQDMCWEKVQLFLEYAKELGASQVNYDVLPGLGHNAGAQCIRKMIEHFKL